MNWVYLPAFDPDDPHPHGGVHRSRQIREALALSGRVRSVSPGSARAPRPAELARVASAAARWRLRPAHAAHYLRFFRSLAPLRREGETLCLYEHQAGMGRIGAMAALDLGFELVACPHNLEAIANWDSDDPLTGRRASAALDWEWRFLRRMKAVLAISREETWLLRNLGLPAARYPYWPDTAAQAELREIRAARAARPADGAILVLGSALNTPTAEGMSRLLSRLAPRRCSVVGQGVSRLADHHRDPALEFHDQADAATLARLQTEAPFACIHQDRGAGALTRIRHLQLAGVPVLCNEIAARDYHGEPGLAIYSRLPQLDALLDAASARNRLDDPPTPGPSLAEALASAVDSVSTTP